MLQQGALIEFVCSATHAGEDANTEGPTITLHEDRWAYCRGGGRTRHTWTRITPTPFSEVVLGQHRTGQ
jgi:hypothetical protein